jgi:hypothetical protein
MATAPESFPRGSDVMKCEEAADPEKENAR